MLSFSCLPGRPTVYSRFPRTFRHETGTQAAMVSGMAGVALLLKKCLKIRCITPYTLLPSIFLSSFFKGSMM